METPSLPTPHTEPVKQSSLVKNILITFALILLGTFLGVLASRFVPMTPTSELPLEPEISPTEEMMIEETPIPEPTATSAALLDLKWNMMTVKSPLTAFSSYRIYYPTTWSIKEYKNVPLAGDSGSSTLRLVKDGVTVNIFQTNQMSPICDYSGNIENSGEGVVMLGDFRDLMKDGVVWRWAPEINVTIPEYLVCQDEATGVFTDKTSIGLINFSGEIFTPDLLEEINYILEKIVILP